MTVDQLGIEIVTNPEIVIGLVGPIGVQLEPVQKSIFKELAALNYRHEFIKVTDLMQDWDIGEQAISKDSFSGYYRSLIRYANGFRKRCENNSALAALAIDEIRNRRLNNHRKSSNNLDATDEELRDRPVLGTAYILRQFKLPQEIELLRRTYGRKFIQISVFWTRKSEKSHW